MKTSTSNFQTYLLHRDFIAVICAIILARLSHTYTSGSESLSASIDLSFYTDFTSHVTRTSASGSSGGSREYDYKIAKPVPFDLDGDGIIEAIVVACASNLKDSGSQEWGLKVLDLKPLHHEKLHDASSAPFYPDAIFTTKGRDAVPVKMMTGQIILQDVHPLKKDPQDDVPSNHCYCGTSWHDASSKCSTHCPSGSQSDCAPGETCFADTSCGINNSKEEGKKVEDYVKTPINGLPSVATVWSNGDVSLHSITIIANSSAVENKLGLVEMWNVNPFDSPSSSSARADSDGHSDWLDFVEVDLILETHAPVGTYGALVVAARLNQDAFSDESSTLYFALDAFTGEE